MFATRSGICCPAAVAPNAPPPAPMPKPASGMPVPATVAKLNHATDRLTAADAVFCRDRRREPGEGSVERIGIGQQGRAGVRTAQSFVVVSVRVEVEHRLSATGGQAGELDEGLVDDRLFFGRERTRGDVIELVERTRLRGRARAERGVDTDEGAQRAVAGRRAGVEFDTAESAEPVIVALRERYDRPWQA